MHPSQHQNLALSYLDAIASLEFAMEKIEKLQKENSKLKSDADWASGNQMGA